MKKLTDDYCPFCNSGNIVKSFIDEPQTKEYFLIRFNPLPPPSVAKHIELAPNRTDWLATYKNNTPPEGMKDYKIIVKGSISVVRNWIKQRYSNCIDNNIRFELHKDKNINIVFLPKFRKGA